MTKYTVPFTNCNFESRIDLLLPKINLTALYSTTIMRGPRTIALRRGLIAPATRSLPATSLISRTVSTASRSSRSPIIPAAGVSGKIRWHSTQPGPSSPIPEISQENTYDTVIIGAANAGLALACSLCKFGLFKR